MAVRSCSSTSIICDGGALPFEGSTRVSICSWIDEATSFSIGGGTASCNSGFASASVTASIGRTSVDSYGGTNSGLVSVDAWTGPAGLLSDGAEISVDTSSACTGASSASEWGSGDSTITTSECASADNDSAGGSSAKTGFTVASSA